MITTIAQIEKLYDESLPLYLQPGQGAKDLYNSIAIQLKEKPGKFLLLSASEIKMVCDCIMYVNSFSEDETLRYSTEPMVSIPGKSFPIYDKDVISRQYSDLKLNVKRGALQSKNSTIPAPHHTHNPFEIEKIRAQHKKNQPGINSSEFSVPLEEEWFYAAGLL